MIAFLLAISAFVVVNIQPAEAHGTATVNLCIRDNNDTWDSGCSPAVYANCLPTSATCTAVSNGPRLVDVKLSGFTANTTVDVWWLNGATPTDSNRYDCGKSGDESSGITTRTLLRTVTVTGGKAEFNETLPNSDWINGSGVDEWSYGSNWVCATDVPLGDSGIVGDRLFTIYPLPL